MSRSYRHTPIRGNGGDSEKQDKRIYNRRLRRAVRTALVAAVRGDDCDSLILPLVRDVSNPWDMSKDGKSYDKSTAEVSRTLRRDVRVRDGRTRKLLAITEETIALAARRQEEMSLRFGYYSTCWFDTYIASRDANFYVNGLRK
ncbi:MAG: hypothetical protein K2W82_14145 [Candidatus Obscuribacterales bacterium]|nr:hypothetical protein [Candidatus Obscuribacterales bacterium]